MSFDLLSVRRADPTALTASQLCSPVARNDQ